MQNRILLALLALACAFGLSKNSVAECFPMGMTPSSGFIINCDSPLQTFNLGLTPNPPFANTTTDGEQLTISENGGVVTTGESAINLSGGADIVTTSGDILSDTDVALGTSSGPDMVTMNGGTIRCTAAVSALPRLPASVFMGGNNDTFIMNGGLIDNPTANPALNTDQNNDIIEMNGGTITGNPVAVEMFSGNDTFNMTGGTINGDIRLGTGNDNVTILDGTFNNTIIQGLQGNDTVNIAGNVAIDEIRGGPHPGGNPADTLIFSMNVPADEEQDITNALLAADPALGSIVINGITYSWTTFEFILANLNGVVTTITLSPLGAVNPIGTEHTVTANMASSVGPPEGVVVNFSVSSGPNAGADSGSEGTCSPNPDCTTDANGEVSWTYMSNGIPGTDTIVASFDDQFLGVGTSNTVENIWEVIRNVPTLSEWGLIAMASLLGIIGFMVIRRRQLAA